MKRISKKSIIIFAWILFYIYILLLSYFLFFSERYGRDLITQEYNLQLFKEIKRFFKYREQIGLEGFIVNILGNVLAFMPFGFLLPLLNRLHRRFYVIFLLSLLFSLVVEIAQLLLSVGVFDVDDMFMNTLGGVLGYLVFLVTHSIYKGIEKDRQ